MTAAAADRWLAKIGEIFAWVWACVWACLPVCVFPKWLTMWVRWPLLKQKALLLVKMFTRHRLPFQVKKVQRTRLRSLPQVCLSTYLAALLWSLTAFQSRCPKPVADAQGSHFIAVSAFASHLCSAGPHRTPANRETANEVVFSSGPCWGWVGVHSSLKKKIEIEGDVNVNKKRGE